MKKKLWWIAVCLLALLVTASAPIGGIPFRISPYINSISHYDETGPAIAFGTGSLKNYLVVWQQINPDASSISVYGQMVYPNGGLNGTRGRFSPLTGYNATPDVAYGSTDDHYLVVYATDNLSIRGQRLTNTSTPVGSELTIAVGTSSDHYFNPAIAYSSVSNIYLVVWRHTNGSTSAIEGRTISADGSTFGSLLDFTGLVTSTPQNPAAASLNSNGKFMVVWDQSGSSTTDIFGRMVHTTPSVGFDAAAFVAYDSGYDDYAPSIGSLTSPNGLSGQYLLLCQADYTTLTGTETLIDGHLFSQEGAPAGSMLPVSLASGNSPVAAGNNASQEFLAVWFDGHAAVVARTISPIGSLSPIHYLPANNAWSPAVTAGPLGDFLITVQDFGDGLGTPYDVFGYLWGIRAYLPLIQK